MSKDLFVLYDESSTITDFTQDSRVFTRDVSSLSYLAGANNYLMVGLYKPFYNFFAELTTVTENPVLAFEYWNGASWVTLAATDETKNFKRSGFVKWERELPGWALSTISGESKYWIRISADMDYSLELDGLGLVFSNDNDLEGIERRILKQLAKGDKSFIAYHASARDEIIQKYRNSGNNKRQTNGVLLEKITKWDILDIENIRQASKFLTMAKIHFDVSEQIEDKYYQKYQDYMGLFGDAFGLHLQRLDSDDDGELDTNENNYLRSVEMVRS